MTNPWFRFYHDFIFDEVIETLAFDDQRHFVFVLCLKCAGTLDKEYPAHINLDRVVGRRLGIHGETLDNAKRRLIESGLIDENWQPKSWDRLQFKTDDSKERVARYRERKRKKNQSVGSCNGDVTVTVTAQETDTETENRYSRFDEFWETFADKRGKDAALRVWKRKKLDNIAGQVIAGAGRYAANRGPDRKFWKLAQGWLNDGRWADEQDTPSSKPIAPERQTVFVEVGTPDWAAWRAHDETIKPIQSQYGYGRWLPSKLPRSTSEVA